MLMIGEPAIELSPTGPIVARFGRHFDPLRFWALRKRAGGHAALVPSSFPPELAPSHPVASRMTASIASRTAPHPAAAPAALSHGEHGGMGAASGGHGGAAQQHGGSSAGRRNSSSFNSVAPSFAMPSFAPARDTACIQFRQGNCTYGAACRYSHDTPHGGAGSHGLAGRGASSRGEQPARAVSFDSRAPRGWSPSPRRRDDSTQLARRETDTQPVARGEPPAAADRR